MMTPEERLIRQKIANKKYRQSEKGKAARNKAAKKYHQKQKEKIRQKNQRYFKTWYNNGGKGIIEKTRGKIRDRNQQFIKDYLANKQCIYCGENKYQSLCFHHVDPSNKHKTVSYLANKGSIKKIEEEIKKTVVICANCHNFIHHPNGGEKLLVELLKLGH